MSDKNQLLNTSPHSSPSLLSSNNNGVDSAPSQQQQQQQTNQPTLNKVSVFEGNDADLYNQFLTPEFNVTSYTSNVLKISSISSSLDKLSIGTKEINNELTDRITTNYQELFNQANNITELDSITETLKSGVKNLEESIQRMKKDISEPYIQVKTQILQLKRVQDSCELLRIVIRYLSLVKKLKNHLQVGNRDLSKSAQCIHEINILKQENNLNGIDIIDSQVNWIKTTSDQIITISSTLLYQGMENQNQTEVANSLQVFYNMGILAEKVFNTVQISTESVTKSVKAFLNVNKLVADLPKTGGTNTDRSIWIKIEGLVDSIYKSFIQVLHLQRVLSKIKDPLTHKSLLDTITTQSTSLTTTSKSTTTSISSPTTTTTINNSGESISNIFWKSVIKVLETNLVVASKSSSIIENTFVHEYPKLSRYFLEFVKRLKNYCDVQQSGITGVNLDEYQSMIFRTISIFEKGYLDYSLSKLTNLINSLFPQSSSSWGSVTRSSNVNTIPSSKQLVDLSKAIWLEIEVIQNDNQLLLKVTKVVCKVLDLFSLKIESMIQNNQQSFEIIVDVKPNQSQLINCSLFNTAIQLNNSIQSLLSSHSLQKDSIESIEHSLSNLSTLCVNILTPIITSFLHGVEEIILKIHQEDWSNDKLMINQNRTCSEYMETLQQYISYFQSFYLSKFTPCPIVNVQIKSMIARIFTLFLRNCSMLKPISEKGKLRLANDLTHLELSVSPLIPEGIKEVGPAYQWIRTYRHFIFKDHNSELFQSASELNSLPLLVVVHNLMSRGPKDMYFPYQFANWTIEKYNHWIDTHNEDEHLQFSKIALDSYVQLVNKKGEKEYSNLYPIILNLLTNKKK
eukprot:gene4257-5327_t